MLEIGVNMYWGLGPGSCCAPEIQALPCFRRAEISAMETSQAHSQRCWFSKACKCDVTFPFKGACCSCKTHAYPENQENFVFLKF